MPVFSEQPFMPYSAYEKGAMADDYAEQPFVLSETRPDGNEQWKLASLMESMHSPAHPQMSGKPQVFEAGEDGEFIY